MRFRAAMPHELDGVKLTKKDLPTYVERCKELTAENARSFDALNQIVALLGEERYATARKVAKEAIDV